MTVHNSLNSSYMMALWQIAWLPSFLASEVDAMQGNAM